MFIYKPDFIKIFNKYWNIVANEILLKYLLIMKILNYLLQNGVLLNYLLKNEILFK